LEKESFKNYVFVPKQINVINFKTELKFFIKKKEDLQYLGTFRNQIKEIKISQKGLLYKFSFVLKGLGFRIFLKRSLKQLVLKIGYSYYHIIKLPNFITKIKTSRQKMQLKSTDKSLLSDFVKKIYRLRLPHLYKERGFYFKGQKRTLKPINKKKK
jgi:ribosomal protein L6P/L9E